MNLREQPGYVTIRAGTAKNSKKRTVDLTPRARAILEDRNGRTGLVFRNADGGPLYHTWLDQQHAEIRTLLGFPEEFVLHSLRHPRRGAVLRHATKVRVIEEEDCVKTFTREDFLRVMEVRAFCCYAGWPSTLITRGDCRSPD